MQTNVSRFESRIVLVAATALVVGVLSYAPGAAACTPTTDAFGVTTGCCNANGTPMALNTSCIVPSNPCQRNKCTAPSGSNAGTCSNASNLNAGGHPQCISATDSCKVGECYNQVCTYVGNDQTQGFTDRCDDNVDCTGDMCNKDGSGNFINCTHTTLTNNEVCDDSNPPLTACQQGECQGGACIAVPAPGQDCSDSTGNTCTPKICDSNGVCQPNGPPITCSGTPSVCHEFACAWVSGSPTCTLAKQPVGTNCDTDAHDCKNQSCLSTGKCGNQAQPVGTVCDDNFATPLVDCQTGVCSSRKECAGITGDSNLNGQVCQTDSDPCSTQTCQDGVCNTGTCNGSGTACTIGGGCGTTTPGVCSSGTPPCSCVSQ
jgi:hypothetical protein